MKPPPKFLDATTGLYRRLLILLPARHRREFGEPMTQLFRDQCRDACRQPGWAPLALFIFRTLVDLSRSAAIERIDSVKSSLRMKPAVATFLRAALAGIAVFLLILGIAVAGLMAQPKVYRSTARVQIDKFVATGESLPTDPFHLQTLIELLLSQENLDTVIRELDLGRSWSLGPGVPRIEVRRRLRSRIEVRQVRNTSLLEVRSYETDPNRGAEIANRLVQALVQAHPDRPEGALRSSVRVVDLAEPGLRPIRPNPYLWSFLGIVTGGLGGLLTVSGVWWAAWRSRPATFAT